MANGTADSITPFFSIWTEPRATIRRIVNTDPTRNVIALAAVAAALGVLESQWSRAMSNGANLSALWPLGVALKAGLGAGLGIIVLYMNGAVIRWSGGLLGGTASSVEVRAAIAWSEIPAIVAAAVGLAAVLSGVAAPAAINANGMPKMTPQFIQLGLLHAILGIWGLIISLQCIGEVHQFSAWRALGAVLIPFAMLLALVGICVWIVFAITHN